MRAQTVLRYSAILIGTSLVAFVIFTPPFSVTIQLYDGNIIHQRPYTMSLQNNTRLNPTPVTNKTQPAPTAGFSNDDLLPEKPINDHEDGVGVVNPHPYKVILSNQDICRVKNLFMLVYVHSAADNYRLRAMIRQTWGDVKRFPNMRVMFVMGKTTSIKMMQDALHFESTTYGDILQEDFEDTYHNLTFKGIGALKFISHYCNNVKYILKTDDDVFVNMYTLQNHLMQLNTAGYNKNLILCKFLPDMPVMREGQWAVSTELYPDELYLPYCSGMAYLFSTDVALKLYEASFFVKYFWVDDVYITGMLRQKNHLNSSTAMYSVYCEQTEMGPIFTHPTVWYKYVFTHVHAEELFLRTWDGLSKIAEKETIPTPSKIAPGVLADFYEPKDKVKNESSF